MPSLVAVLGAAAVSEGLVLAVIYIGNWAAGASCTTEYEPNLEFDSPRYSACDNDDLAFVLIPVAVVFVPLAAAVVLIRVRGTLRRVGFVVLAAVFALTLVFLRFELLSSSSPTG